MCCIYVGGWKCLNGSFTIQTNFDDSSADLKQFAMEHRGWTPSDGELNFARVFSTALWHEDQQYSGAIYFQHIAENGVLLLNFFVNFFFNFCAAANAFSCSW